MEGRCVDDNVIKSSEKLVHPVVLRNVFFMAVDEMDKIYDLDVKVCFYILFIVKPNKVKRRYCDQI